MALVNRDKDVSEQREVTHVPSGVLGTGITYPLMVVPYPCELQQFKVVSQGLSGAPIGAVEALRFIVGSGLTGLVGLGATLTLSAVGTSGVQSVSLIAPGSTLIQLQAGDVLVWRSGAANAAISSGTFSFVLKALSDIKNQYNNF